MDVRVINKAECQISDAFELWCWRSLLRVFSLGQQRYHFVDRKSFCQSYDFSSSHVWMWELDHREGESPKNWCFQTVMLEKTLEGPLYSKKIMPIYPKRNHPSILTGRTDAEAPILWPPDAKSQLIGKDSDAGKDWRQRRRGWQRVRWLNGVTNSMDMNLGKLWEMVRDRNAWHAAVHRVTTSPTYLTYTPSTSWETLGWMKHKLESRLPGEISINLRYADNTTLTAESEEELKGLLMKVKEEWKSWLKAQHS